MFGSGMDKVPSVPVTSEHDPAADVGVGRHGELGAGPVADLDRPGLTVPRPDRRNAGERAEEVHESCEVVRADVEQRARRRGEQELRVRVEHPRTGVLDHGLRAQRGSSQTRV